MLHLLFNKEKSRTGNLTFLSEAVPWVGNISRIVLKITQYWFFWAIRSQVFYPTACFTLSQNVLVSFLYGPFGVLEHILVHHLIWSAGPPCVPVGSSEPVFPVLKWGWVADLSSSHLVNCWASSQVQKTPFPCVAPSARTLKLMLDFSEQYLEYLGFLIT